MGWCELSLWVFTIDVLGSHPSVGGQSLSQAPGPALRFRLAFPPHRGEVDVRLTRVGMRLVPRKQRAQGDGQSCVVVVDVELVGGRVSSCPPKRFVDDVPSLSLFFSTTTSETHLTPNYLRDPHVNPLATGTYINARKTTFTCLFPPQL